MHRGRSGAIVASATSGRIATEAMRDLTRDSIARHILTMAAPAGVSMVAHIAYQLVDLYFVTRIGAPAAAGVNAAGNALLVIAALAQVLIAGTLALVAHAVGRGDRADANLAFNQSIVLALASSVVTAAFLYACVPTYMRAIAADAPTADAGIAFMAWVLPGYSLTLPMVVFSAALRACGIVRPTMVIYILTVVINALLAPVLIAGWGTGVALGVRGAGLATSISIIVCTVLLGAYFQRSQTYMALQPALATPRLRQWSRILVIGLPAGGEFVLTLLYTAVVYYAIRDLGVSAQAGFSIGSRVLQAILLPGMAIAFAAGPVVGQNFAARKCERVRETFEKAALMATAIMVATTLIVQSSPRALVAMFGADAPTTDVAALFLQLMSWIFVAQGLIYICSTVFQGLGNTVPALISSAVRFVGFAGPALWLSMRPTFHIETLWYLSILSVALQAVVSLTLVRSEFRSRCG
jgi:putative MATE family efflux protein